MVLADNNLSTNLSLFSSVLPQLEEKIAAQLPAMRTRIQRLVKEHGDQKIGEVTVAQVFGGLRGVNMLTGDISYVDPYDGIQMRGLSIDCLMEKLPKRPGTQVPLAGGVYYLLLIGEMPTLEDALMIEDEWKERRLIPGYVLRMLKAMPQETHPMTMFSQAVLAMQNESEFVRAYQNGLRKPDYWRPTLEDSLNLTAKLPALAAYIYNLKYRDGQFIPMDLDMDWSANFAHMIGKEDDLEYQELCRLFFFLHADQGRGNVTAHTTHLVSSTLSDVYYACSAGLNGLAGPLHGLANQECLRWLLDLRAGFGGLPSRAQLENFAWRTLDSGQVIPGYGHAVLRHTDPRFTAQLEFGKKYMPDDDLFKLVELVYQVVPRVLTKLGKVKSPWPNVDAISGTLQYHYGVREFDFYTVLFGVSRMLGVTAACVWERALGQPIERPKSMTTDMLEKLIGLDAE
jgi:citrate synthase